MSGVIDPSSLKSQPGRVRVRTLVVTRWIAVAGQVCALLVVSEGLEVAVPMIAAMAMVGCSALLNVVVGLRWRLAGWHTDTEAAAFLAYDILQLAILLYLTGGLTNPFALLFLVPVTISATILSLGSTVGLGLLAVLCISFLAHFHLPLPWPGGRGIVLPPLYIMGVWVAETLGMGFLMFYAWRVADEARRMSDALAETRLALAREQELSSLGGLAAAAAHELGTPLGTIALVAKELARELPADGDFAEDVRLLSSQAERCRDILARLAQNPRDRTSLPFNRMPLAAMVDSAAEPYRRFAKLIRIERSPANGSPEPVVSRSPELLQGLGNLIENAVHFARRLVVIRIVWDSQMARVEIADDGPGFAAEVLGMLGEPYVTTRRDAGGMGLGVFISKTLLERTGAEVGFRNQRRGRGALVEISWPRRRIEGEASAAAP